MESLNQSTGNSPLTRQEKGAEEGIPENESQGLLHSQFPQPARAQVPGSRGHMGARDGLCTSPVAPSRRQVTMEPNTDQPPTTAKSGQSGRVVVRQRAGLRSVTQELGDAPGEEPSAAKAEASCQLEGLPHPQTTPGQFPGRQPPFWSLWAPKSFLSSQRAHIPCPSPGWACGSFLCLIGELFPPPLPGTHLISAPLSYKSRCCRLQSGNC